MAAIFSISSLNERLTSNIIIDKGASFPIKLVHTVAVDSELMNSYREVVEPSKEDTSQSAGKLDRAPSAFETTKIIFTALRPKQWAKNLIAFIPLLFAGRVFELHSLCATIGCFVALCMISSGVYIVNDLFDIQADRLHPTKRFRPIASGKFKSGWAAACAVVLLNVGLTIGLAVRPCVALVSLVYLTLTLSYTVKLKHTAILDVFVIATGFVLRAVAGALAIAVPMSGWFLLCTSLGALYLALEKRRKEIVVLGKSSGVHRKALANYSVESLDRMEGMVVPSLVTAYMFYGFFSPHGEWMLLTVPPVLYGIMRYQMLSEANALTASPEEVLWKDRPIQIAILVWILASASVIYKIAHIIPSTFTAFDKLLGV